MSYPCSRLSIVAEIVDRVSDCNLIQAVNCSGWGSYIPASCSNSLESTFCREVKYDSKGFLSAMERLMSKWRPITRCDALSLDVTPYHSTWRPITRRDALSLDVTPYHSTWRPITRRDALSLDVTENNCYFILLYDVNNWLPKFPSSPNWMFVSFGVKKEL